MSLIYIILIVTIVFVIIFLKDTCVYQKLFGKKVNIKNIKFEGIENKSVNSSSWYLYSEKLTDSYGLSENYIKKLASDII